MVAFAVVAAKTPTVLVDVTAFADLQLDQLRDVTVGMPRIGKSFVMSQYGFYLCQNGPEIPLATDQTDIGDMPVD
jgi:hypothetical protein